MKTTKATRNRHLDYLCHATLFKDSYSLDNIQFKIFEHDQEKILYIHGSNESKDWAFNSLYLGLFYHLGFLFMARKIEKIARNEKDLIIVGHSMGAGVASILYWIMRKRVKEVVLFACPSSYTVLSPLYPTKCTNYRIVGDVIGLTSLLRPFRQPKPVEYLEYNGTPLEKHEIKNYKIALKNS